MKSAYKYLALAIALDVLLQAASIAYAVSGLASYVDDGHQVAEGTLADAHFTGVGGYALHATNGMVVIPLLAIALLVVALLSRIPGAARQAGILLVMVVVQVGLGGAAGAVPILGALHGVLALAVFGFATMIGVRAIRAETSTSSTV
ncbi:MAG TPA: hypothetical protein VIL10_07845 [Marmoricola sp.]|jgi:hypothetical protein